MNPYYRPRRSMLYVPGCSMRYLNKARTLRVDSVILDLGDPILVENIASIEIFKAGTDGKPIGAAINSQRGLMSGTPRNGRSNAQSRFPCERD